MINGVVASKLLSVDTSYGERAVVAAGQREDAGRSTVAGRKCRRPILATYNSRYYHFEAIAKVTRRSLPALSTLSSLPLRHVQYVLVRTFRKGVATQVCVRRHMLSAAVVISNAIDHTSFTRAISLLLIAQKPHKVSFPQDTEADLCRDSILPYLKHIQDFQSLASQFKSPHKYLMH